MISTGEMHRLVVWSWYRDEELLGYGNSAEKGDLIGAESGMALKMVGIDLRTRRRWRLTLGIGH
jgi:hypothetical protein